MAYSLLSHASSVMLVATSSRVSASESWKKRMPQSRDTVFTSAQTMSLSAAMFEVLNEECV